MDINTKLRPEEYLVRIWSVGKSKLETKLTTDKDPMIKKNFGQRCLKRVLACFWSMSLFIAGAIRTDWNKIIPETMPQIINGICIIILIVLMWFNTVKITPSN